MQSWEESLRGELESRAREHVRLAANLDADETEHSLYSVRIVKPSSTRSGLQDLMLMRKCLSLTFPSVGLCGPNVDKAPQRQLGDNQPRTGERIE